MINLGAGVYNVTIVDENGCNTSRSYLVEESSNIQAFSEGLFQSCSEGIVNITSVDGGTPPYTYFWVDDPTNDSTILSGVAPGYHTFYIFDSFNCEYIDSTLISGNNEIFTSLNVESNVLCHGDSSGQLSLDIINDDHYPYSYSVMTI